MLFQVWRPVVHRLSPAHLIEPLCYDLTGHGAARDMRVDRFGTPPAWEGFAVADAQQALSCLPRGLPAVGVGHSIGGAAMVKLELAHPGSFSRLVLCEPVLLGMDVPFHAQSVLAERTAKRRSKWASVQDAREFLGSRPMYQGLHPEAFDGYLDGGLVVRSSGECSLACCPDVESVMYRSVGRSVYGELDKVGCPVTIVVGEHSDFVATVAGTETLSFFQNLARRFRCANVEVMAGVGHLAPLEDPEQFAHIVSQAVEAQLQEKSAMGSVTTAPGKDHGGPLVVEDTAASEVPLVAEQGHQRSRL